MGKMSRWQVRERARRVAEGLNPYHPTPKQLQPWAVPPGPSQAERSSAGYQAGRASRRPVPMAYTTRQDNYLRQNRPEAPHLAGLTPAQVRRLNKKLRSQLAGHKRSRSSLTRREAMAARISGRKRTALAGHQAEIRRLAFTEPSPRVRAANRREAKRERQGTHAYR